MKKYIIPAFCLAMIIFLGVRIFGDSNNNSSPSSPYKVFFGNALTVAKMMVKDSLKAPSTAKFQDSVLIEDAIDESRKAHYFLVHVSVDAQNSFGAMIRENFLVPIFFKDGSTKEYGYNSKTPMATCSANPQEKEIAFAKAIIDWPTAK